MATTTRPLADYFAELRYPRVQLKCEHDFLAIILIVVCATAAEAADFVNRAATSNSAVDLADKDYRTQCGAAVTSEDLQKWIRTYVSAKRRVIILDTCAAGTAAGELTDKRDVPGDQKTALYDLRDRTGLFQLLGCAADRGSYESSEYAQGLLTYAILEGKASDLPALTRKLVEQTARADGQE